MIDKAMTIQQLSSDICSCAFVLGIIRGIIERDDLDAKQKEQQIIHEIDDLAERVFYR